MGNYFGNGVVTTKWNNSGVEFKVGLKNNAAIKQVLYQHFDELRYHMKIIAGNVVKNNILKLFVVRR